MTNPRVDTIALQDIHEECSVSKQLLKRTDLFSFDDQSAEDSLNELLEKYNL